MLGYVIWTACQYEAHALATGRVPTITKICWRIRNSTAGVTVIVAALAWLAAHLLMEGRQTSRSVECRR